MDLAGLKIDDNATAIERLLAAALEREAAAWPVAPRVRSNARPCEHPGCDRPHLANGLCNAHLIRKRDGRPMEGRIRNRVRGALCRLCEAPTNNNGAWGLCHKHYRARRAQIIKGVLIAFFGGVCSGCEGTFHPAAFDFHHLGDKDEAIGDLIANGSLARIAAEVLKCCLMCANCHRVEHAR